jgi:hypothetical protein
VRCAPEAAANIALVAALGVSFACLSLSCSPSSQPPGEPCATGFLGSASSAPDFTFLVVNAHDSVLPLNDGDTVPMIFPPQGGRVIFAGARATNVDGCGLQLSGLLRDETSRVVTVDKRTVNLVPTGDGWGVSGAANVPVSGAISNFANIPVCPNHWSTTDVYGHEYGLEVTIQDRGGRQLTKKIRVTPQCGEPDRLAECLCICKAGYIEGASCPSDAGDAEDAVGGE